MVVIGKTSTFAVVAQKCFRIRKPVFSRCFIGKRSFFSAFKTEKWPCASRSVFVIKLPLYAWIKVSCSKIKIIIASILCRDIPAVINGEGYKVRTVIVMLRIVKINVMKRVPVRREIYLFVSKFSRCESMARCNLTNPALVFICYWYILALI